MVVIIIVVIKVIIIKYLFLASIVKTLIMRLVLWFRSVQHCIKITDIVEVDKIPK